MAAVQLIYVERGGSDELRKDIDKYREKYASALQACLSEGERPAIMMPRNEQNAMYDVLISTDQSGNVTYRTKEGSVGTVPRAQLGSQLLFAIKTSSDVPRVTMSYWSWGVPFHFSYE